MQNTVCDQLLPSTIVEGFPLQQIDDTLAVDAYCGAGIIFNADIALNTEFAFNLSDVSRTKVRGSIEFCGSLKIAELEQKADFASG